MKKKTVIPIAVITVVVVVLVFIFVGVNRSGLKNQENEAAFFAEKGDYIRAQEEYQKLFEETNKSRYAEKRDALEPFIRSKRAFIEGKEAFEDKKYAEGAEAFEGIIEEDEASRKEAARLIKEHRDGILKAASALKKDEPDDYADFKKTLTALSEDDTLFASLSEEEASEGESEEVEEEAEDEDEEISDEETRDETDRDKPKEKAKKGDRKLLAEAKKEAKNYTGEDRRVGKTVRTAVPHSNVRSGPGLDYSIVTSVSEGATVYIFDAVGEYERTWYRGIITSAETGNSYDAWISSKNLE